MALNDLSDLTEEELNALMSLKLPQEELEKDLEVNLQYSNYR